MNNTTTIQFDNTTYEVPQPVVDRMKQYYDTMTALVEGIKELADLEAVARSKGAKKDDRLKAWYAKKALFNKVGKNTAKQYGK